MLKLDDPATDLDILRVDVNDAASDTDEDPEADAELEAELQAAELDTVLPLIL